MNGWYFSLSLCRPLVCHLLQARKRWRCPGHCETSLSPIVLRTRAQELVSGSITAGAPSPSPWFCLVVTPSRRKLSDFVPLHPRPARAPPFQRPDRASGAFFLVCFRFCEVRPWSGVAPRGVKGQAPPRSAPEVPAERRRVRPEALEGLTRRHGAGAEGLWRDALFGHFLSRTKSANQSVQTTSHRNLPIHPQQHRIPISIRKTQCQNL